MKNDENKIEIAIEKLSDSVNSINKKIDGLEISMDKKFLAQDKKFDQKIDDLALSVARGFSDQNDRFEKRFNKLEKDNVWIKGVLESHTGMLNRLDQERMFTINYINRLESEINKIKKQLKIA